MRKITTCFLALFAALTLVGCSSAPSTPGEVTVEFIKLYNKGEIDKSMKLVCFAENEEPIKDEYIQNIKARFKELIDLNDYEVVSVKAIKELDAGEYAEVTYELQQKLNGEIIVETEIVSLIKTSDGWKVGFDSIREF